MSEQMTLARDLSIADALKDFYAAPHYHRRKYVWPREQVEQLLGDINGAWEDGGARSGYFIGVIIVSTGPGGMLELIDGRQRMATLFVALCAIRDRFKELGLDPPGILARQILNLFTITGRGRVDLQHEDSGDVLKRIARGDARADLRAETRSTRNIVRAYDAALAYFQSTFADDGAGLKQFHAYLCYKVRLIRIQIEDVAAALKVFETINDRGVGRARRAGGGQGSR